MYLNPDEQALADRYNNNTEVVNETITRLAEKDESECLTVTLTPSQAQVLLGGMGREFIAAMNVAIAVRDEALLAHAKAAIDVCTAVVAATQECPDTLPDSWG